MLGKFAAAAAAVVLSATLALADSPVGRYRIVGTGIGGDQGFALAYRSANQTGIAIDSAKGPGGEGVWTYTGGRTIGGEVWTRR